MPTRYGTGPSTTFAQDIEAAAAGEAIEAVVIGGVSASAKDPLRFAAADALAGRVWTWAEARPALDYDYAGGFGMADCHAIYAWTATRVLVVGTYDGSTWVEAIPRHPTADTKPEKVGGG